MFRHRFLTPVMMPGMDLKSDQKVVGYTPDVCTTIALVSMSCQAGHYYNTQYSQVAKTDHTFSRQHAVRLRVETHRFISPAPLPRGLCSYQITRPTQPNTSELVSSPPQLFRVNNPWSNGRAVELTATLWCPWGQRY